ncbi:MAG TPA: amino acid adenylation domain-containing protein, partial [Thermoanaerobaculia bacterium]|nr:amino acid adenylation domain-containing protein [Thermoanaerobaculia bacterium]
MSGSKPSFRFAGKRRELLDALRREQGPASETSHRIPRRERREGSGPAPLSFSQQRLWFLDQLEPGGAAYNLAAALGLRGRLDVPALAAALRALALRHEALRTTFPSVEGEPVQSVAAEPRAALPVVDLGGLEDDEAEAGRLALAEAVRPFDLAAGPLLRAILVRRSGGDHRLVVVLHHIVADGWSRGILLREVGELYGAAREGRAPRLPELPIQYADYAVWQRGLMQGETLTELLGFWRGRLAGLTSLELPADRPRPAVPSGRGGQRPARLSVELAERLRTLAHGAEATLFMTLLAGWDALLLRHGAAPDVAVGAPVANRDRAETAGLIGFFVNTLVLRADLSDDPSFGDLLSRVRRETLEVLARQELPFEKLVEELQPDRDLGRQPLFQVMLALLPAPPEAPRWDGLDVDVHELPTGTAKVDLLLALEEGPEGVTGTCEHSADLFDEVTVDRMLARLEVLLESAAADPSRRLSELALLPASELLQILADAESPDLAEESVDEAEVCLHTLVALQAARTPEAVAVEGAGESVTYRELAGRAGQLAAHLRALGVGPEVPVAVRLERTPDLVVALLAVLEAGGAYVPIDPAYPRDRQEYILADAGAPVLLTRELLGSLPQETGDVVAVPPGPDNLAYVLYTSGSTGWPKGVAVRHRSAVALVRWARQLFPADDLSGVLAATSVCFDLSVFELFVPLACGGRVVLAENALALPTLGDGGVRLVNTVPSAITELLRNGGIPGSVRTVNLAGEPLPPGLAARLYELPHVERVYNLYGPTEDTTYSTVSLVARGAARVSIGRPLPGTWAYVLDRRLRQVPAGVPGELYLGGAGLARGYLGRPDLTAGRFVPDPFAGQDQPGRRLYRTGDLVRTLRDGSLEFLGRLDHQVKVRGFRIELGEIEEVLRSHPAVRDCAVLVREDRPGEMRLVAYAAMPAMAEDRREGWPELRALLASRLPDYMIPAAFVRLDALPLTPSGKVDRRALPAPALAAGDRHEWEAPRTPLEELVAGCWADLLGVPRVGLRDNFFELGGHSLLAARVVARLRSLLGAELPVRALFEQPTVAGLAARVEAARRGGVRTPVLPPLRRSVRPEEVPPLSFAQERLWFLSELEPGSPLYNLPAAIRMRGALDPAALAGALQAVVRRHEALRTAFHESDGRPVQSVAPDLDLPLPLVDLSGLPSVRREPEAARLRGEEARRGFDLGTLPLVRAALQRLDESDHVLILNLHHAVADGWSLGVLAREIRALLEAAASGRPAVLPELTVQYADYALWQREWLRGETLESLLEPWRQRLAGAPGLLPLPTDRPRTALARRRGSYLPVELPGGLSARLEEAARRSGATPFMVLLAAFQVLLGRTADEDDVSVGFPVANRGRAELEGLIGFFVNTLVLRTRLDGEPGFADVLARVREAALDALAHQDLPFERLVEELRPGRNLGHTPLFQVMFVLQNTPPRGADPAGLELSEVDIDTGAARFDLTLTLARADGGWSGRLSFDCDLFDAVTVRRLAGRFERLLAAAVHAPSRPLADLPLLA